MPYWREASGSAEVVNNLNKIDIISPFSFEMTETGTFKDPMKLNTGPYSEMIKKAKEQGKIIVPSILWWATGTGRDDLDFVLRDDDIRGAVIYDIKDAIKKYNLDGIDIDFENKKAESKEPFNKFLTELSKELHDMNKMLICTIEARTPLDSKYSTVTPELLAKKWTSKDRLENCVNVKLYSNLKRMYEKLRDALENEGGVENYKITKFEEYKFETIKRTKSCEYSDDLISI